jgi:hypothetical protein
VSSSATDPVATNNVDKKVTRITGLQLVGFEVTQAIQNLRNTVPLISDRVTWVRAYVRSLEG